MVGKLGKSLLIVVVLALATTGAVFAEEDTQRHKERFLGEITSVDPESRTLTLKSQEGEVLSFTTIERTQFRSRDGSIEGLQDLSPGMKALVSAFRDHQGNLIALMVVAGEVGDGADIHRYTGRISSVNLEERSFTLETKEAGIQRFVVGDRTRYRSRDGSISDLGDLETGMIAFVAAVESENQGLLALLVAARQPNNEPERFRVIGELINVVPGQGTFDLETSNGDNLTFSVIDRTNYHSRDGSINSIHDLKKGMHALVIGVREDDGSLFALVVAAADLDDHPGISRLDVRALGRITSLGDRSFTVETKNQGSLTFSVDGSTIYKSRDGSINNFEDLQVGMTAAVGAKELGNGELKAIIVGVALLQTDKSESSTREQPASLALPEPVSD